MAELLRELLRRRNRPLPRVGFVEDGWGFGPTAKAMAVAEELEGRATRVFVGQESQLELARHGPFERLVDADSMAWPVTPDLKRELDSCSVLVVVMNRRIAQWARRRRIPCVYVDGLAWMRAEAPDVPGDVRYCAENYPGTAETFDLWRSRFEAAEIVGPILSRDTRRRSGEPDDAFLINFGGLSSHVVDPCTLVTYAGAMSQCALDALKGTGGRVIITGGRSIIEQLDREMLLTIRPGVRLTSLSHAEFLAELRRARLLISSPGKTASNEAAACGVPCIYLPAQSLSQTLLLEVMEREGVTETLDWSHLYGLSNANAADEAGEADACRRIANAIRRFGWDVDARHRVTRFLLRSIKSDSRQMMLVKRQTQFVTSLGERGSPHVAAHVLDLLEPRPFFPTPLRHPGAGWRMSRSPKVSGERKPNPARTDTSGGPGRRPSVQ
jgi:hypothetical protein